MRFVLDEDVDARARGTSSDNASSRMLDYCRSAGLAEAPDDDVAVYAWKKNAVPVINDEQFAKRLRYRDNLGGSAVFMDCRDFKLVEYLELYVETIVGLLDTPPLRTHRIVRVKANGSKIWHPDWLH